MRFGTPLLIPVLLAELAAQSGTAPKAGAADYPVRAQLEKLSIGAEYLVHSFSGGRQTFVARDYLVVEVALFPAKGQRLEVNDTLFALRINGKNQTLAAQAPQFVAASLKYPDWESQRQTEATAGPVILGRPQPVERFPGDPQARRLPTPPRAPTTDNPGAQDSEPPVSAEDLVVQTALPEGEAAGPVSGFLYFAYRGKTRNIHSLELLFNSPAGNTTLKIL